MAALREKKVAIARIQLMELVEEFPQKPLFYGELAKLDLLTLWSTVSARKSNDERGEPTWHKACLKQARDMRATTMKFILPSVDI